MSEKYTIKQICDAIEKKIVACEKELSELKKVTTLLKEDRPISKMAHHELLLIAQYTSESRQSKH